MYITPHTIWTLCKKKSSIKYYYLLTKQKAKIKNQYFFVIQVPNFTGICWKLSMIFIWHDAYNWYDKY